MADTAGVNAEMIEYSSRRLNNLQRPTKPSNPHEQPPPSFQSKHKSGNPTSLSNYQTDLPALLHATGTRARRRRQPISADQVGFRLACRPRQTTLSRPSNSDRATEWHQPLWGRSIEFFQKKHNKESGRDVSTESDLPNLNLRFAVNVLFISR